MVDQLEDLDHLDPVDQDHQDPVLEDLLNQGHQEDQSDHQEGRLDHQEDQ